MFSELICPSTRIRKSVLVYAFLALITAFGDPLALSTPRQQLLPFSSLRSPSYSSFCCPPSWKVQQFWQSAILYSIRNPGHKITFSQCSTKSIAVIIMCSRPSKKTTFLIFYHVQQHENQNSDKLIVCFSLGKG